MGFFGDVWQAATAPLVAASNVVSDVAHLRIGDALKNSVGTIAALNPLQGVDVMSGGKLKSVVSNAPLLGGTTNKFLTSGENLASGNGSLGDLTNYGTSSAILGASAVGAGALYTAGVSGTTGLIGATTLDKAVKGDLSGALASGSSLAGGIDLGIGLPGGVGDAYNAISPYLGGSGGAGTSLANHTIGGAPSASAANKGTTNDMILPIVLLGAGTLGAYYLLRKK